MLFIMGCQIHRQKPSFEWCFAILVQYSSVQAMLLIARYALNKRTASASGIDCLDTIHNKTRMDIEQETPYTNIDDKK